MPDDLPMRTDVADFLRLVRLDILCVALGTLVIAHAVPLVGPFGQRDYRPFDGSYAVESP